MDATRSPDAGGFSLYAALLAPVAELRGIGPSLAGRLAARGVHTLGDLLLHLPSRYLDDRRIVPVAGLRPGEEARIRGRVLERRAHGHGRKRQVTIRLADDSGAIALHFFHSGYMMRDARLAEGREISVRGKAEIWRGEWRMTHPAWCAAEAHVPAIVPVYPALAGARSARVAGWIAQALARLPEEEGPLDALAGGSLAAALRAIHAPSDLDADARRAWLARLKAEELAVYLAMMRERKRLAACPGPALRDDALDRRLIASLPFPLTAAQREAWTEIAADMASGRRMHRLLQGDVGAGKTWVAALAIARAAGNGGQAALMAPTEVLARQHPRTLSELLASLGLKVGLLTGGMRAAARREALAALASGEWHAVAGTHALLGEEVRFARLALALVDEQHRFGVRQRWALADKGAGEAVHMLGMTATPIPRSMALALYGDMELSVMRGMPPGRKPVETRVLPAARLAALRAGIRRMLDAGGRVYWIAPRIDEEEDGASVAQRAQALARHFPDAGVRALHGRMKAGEKQAALAAFAAGECRLLVSTTVVEVGVNVPEARLIVIEQAESYGLAQLHQLRGRVGRSSAQGYCMLIAGENAPASAIARLSQMVRCHDGLELAEADLRLRGAGDALGVRQSGESGFRLVDPVADAALVREWHARLERDAPQWTPDPAMQAFWRPEAAPVD